MPDYKQGKIYTIRCKMDDSLIYVGSTCETLCSRFSKHKYESKKNPNINFYSFVNDWSDWYIELFEDYPCERREQLLQKEGEITRQIGNLNTFIPGNYVCMGQKEYMKNYRSLNEEKLKSQKHENYEKNKETISEVLKQKYNDEGKEKILCECGMFSSKHHFTRHLKSLGHMKKLNLLDS